MPSCTSSFWAQLGTRFSGLVLKPLRLYPFQSCAFFYYINPRTYAMPISIPSNVAKPTSVNTIAMGQIHNIFPSSFSCATTTHYFLLLLPQFLAPFLGHCTNAPLAYALGPYFISWSFTLDNKHLSFLQIKFIFCNFFAYRILLMLYIQFFDFLD